MKVDFHILFSITLDHREENVSVRMEDQNKQTRMQGRDMIYLIPIQDRKTLVDPMLLKTLCEALQDVFQQECQIQSPVKPHIYGRSSGSSQYTGARLLESLPIQKGAVTLGVTGLDLSMIGHEYTTGLADPSNQRAIIAVSRLQSQTASETNDEKFTDRVIKRAIHEIGHTLGLQHCEADKCVMQHSETVEDMDNKTHAYCPKCVETIEARVQVA